MKIVIDIPKEKYQVIKTAMYARVGEDMAKQLIKYIKNGKPLKREPKTDIKDKIISRMWNCRGKKTLTIDKVKMETIIREEFAEQEPKWIPVSKKMPEDGQSVLFCDVDDDVMIGYHVKGRPETHFSQDGSYEDIKNVRAWRPLPKPYSEV